MERRLRNILASLAAAATIASLGASPASGATITVNTLADAVPAAGAAGCTLRKAIENVSNGAQTHAACAAPTGGDTIVFSVNGIIQLVAGAAGTGVLNIIRSVTINGNGIANTVIRGAPNEHVFDNFGGGVMTITWSNLTIANGTGSLATGFTNAGAAYIETTTTATMDTVLVTNNTAVSSAGAIDNRGNLTIVNSTFSGNSAPGQGGAIRTQGTLTVTKSTFTGNSSGEGGAIHHASATVTDTVSITNSTFSGNTATAGTAGGGAIAVNSNQPLTLTYVTIANNSATAGSGGGIRFNPATLGGGSVTIAKSIIAGNTSVGAGTECATTSTSFTSQNFNVFGTLSGCTLGTQASDFTGAALLNALASNGGPTQTISLQPFSPARGRIPAASCVLTTDQRGVARPTGTNCDSGAYEANPTVPQAPTIGTATAGVGQATVTFTAPGNNGDSPILGYTATSSPGGITGTCAAPCSSIVVSGLAGGTVYTFTVTAANVVGSSAASAASNAVTPTGPPGAPVIGTATAGVGQATVSFTAPASNGGSPITGYTATSSPGGFTGTCAAPCTSILVTGLANGTAYTFTVTATNAVATGPASAASNSVTPATVPDAPTIGTATPGSGQATVAFTAPAFNGGSAITGYTATSSPGGFTGTCAAPCTSIVVGGLSNGTSYAFTVTATNAIGTGAASASSNSVTPVGLPGAPTIGTATAGNAQVSVTFSAPASDGGSPITGYTATSSPSGITGSCAAPCTSILVAGLSNGTAYTFTVSATNANGTGPASAASNTVTPATVPGAPAIGTATAGNAQATVTFAAPASNGGSAISGYTATSSPGGFTGTCAASCTSIVVGGLTNGTAYTFTVTATNAVGTGPASSASNSVTPATVPGAPSIGTATAGNAQATVTFAAPAFDGGTPIVGYTATSAPGGITGTCAAPCTSIIVAGLANGTPYSFTVTATNAAGTGAASAASNSVTPLGPPGAPTIGTAAGGNLQATVAFTAPASNGGSPITSYTATSSPGGFTGTCAAPCTSIVVAGLANGTPYTFTVTATNAVGTGAPSAASNSVTPATLPGAPTIGTATPGNAQATVTFTAPASDGGSPIVAYTATSSPAGLTGSCAAPCTSINVAGLANGTAYTFTVTATNAVGTGPASAASNSATPATVPGAPTIGTATGGNAQATVTFTAPASNGGAPIASFTATSSPGGITGTCAAPCTSIVVSGLVNGTAYTFTVTATNAIGTGAASAASNGVTPATVPGAPTIGTATAGNAQATVAFTAPASNGGAAITTYTATSSPSGITGTCAAPCSSIVVAGLANGTAYTFTVTATNSVGTGAASAASNSVTPATVPGAPTIGTATAANAQATVTFTAPASNGGSPITIYTATSAPGGITATCAAPCTSIVVTGLANGTAYTFSVTATNAVGTGAASAASNSATPLGPPGAPTIGTATGGNAQATVTFTAPAATGGTPITVFTATSSPSGITGTCAAPCTSIVVGGLANGTSYTFTVTATNAVGTGPASAASNATTPMTLPGAPTIGTATGGNAQATVTFTAPASTGGSPITTYTATSAPGAITGTCAAPCTSIVVPGLANGTSYTFTVTATNAVGVGPASAASNAVTPASVPGAPTIGTATAGNTQATVTFTAPASTGGSPITTYTATSAPGGITATCAAPCTSIVVTGLTNGTAYTFTVTATNAAGVGPASAASNSVTPIGPPGAPTIGTATRGNGQATVTFTAPASTGGSPITSFTATSAPGGFTGTCSAPCTSIVVAGLANGTSYTFTVTATNAAGTGPASAASNATTPATFPGAPVIGAATPGNLQATIAFSPPASDGGSPITSYTVACLPSGTVSGAASPLTVTGLANGTTYTCAVRATNAIGTGTASATVAVTPAFNTYSAPSATGTGTITASFTGGGAACSFVSPRFIAAPPGSPPVPPIAAPNVIHPHGLFDFSATGCTPGATLSFTIVYPAVLPAGTQYWKYGPTAADPAPHWYVLPSSITGATVTFSITDGGLGDDDLAANGAVVDQGGPGVPAAGAANIPTLGEWAMLVLVAMLGWIGMRKLPRSPRGTPAGLVVAFGAGLVLCLATTSAHATRSITSGVVIRGLQVPGPSGAPGTSTGKPCDFKREQRDTRGVLAGATVNCRRDGDVANTIGGLSRDFNAYCVTEARNLSNPGRLSGSTTRDNQNRCKLSGLDPQEATQRFGIAVWR